MVHGYDIKTSLDFFKKLLDEREDFLKYPHSARHAINCAITAWQLHDWVFAEKSKYPFLNQFPHKQDFRNYLYSREDFRTLHDLADGAKHYELTRRDTTILDTQVSSWDELRQKKNWPKRGKEGDNVPQLFLKMKAGETAFTMCFDDLLYVITHFWYAFFRDKLGEDVHKIFEEGGYSYF